MIEPSFGMVLSDAAGRVMQVDRLVCRLLGYEAPDLLGMTVEMLTHPDDWEVCRRLLERLHRHDEPFSLAKRYVRCDGSLIWMHVHVSLLRDARGKATVSAMVRPVLRSLAPSDAAHPGEPSGGRQDNEASRAGRRMLADRAMLLAALVPGPRPN